MNISIGVFAHNEESNIGDFIRAISEQSILKRSDLNVTVYILANGCSDKTEERAEAAIEKYGDVPTPQITLCKLSEGGKSRTWNRFVHHIAPVDTDYFIFADADISFASSDAFERMYQRIVGTALHVFNSRPIKDLTFSERPLGLVEKVILKSSGKMESYKIAICGQLYIARADAIREIYLPVGLPVEDGFIRAMLLTDMLTHAEDLGRIDGADDIFHIYESITTVRELLRHQTRIIIGSAINEAVFQHMRERATEREGRKSMLLEASGNDGWLNDVLKLQLPKWPYGFVSFHYLTKRLVAFRTGAKKGLSSVAVTMVGFGLDFFVYIVASIKMWRGTGSGYW